MIVLRLQIFCIKVILGFTKYLFIAKMQLVGILSFVLIIDVQIENTDKTTHRYIKRRKRKIKCITNDNQIQYFTKRFFDTVNIYVTNIFVMSFRIFNIRDFVKIARSFLKGMVYVIKIVVSNFILLATCCGICDYV